MRMPVSSRCLIGAAVRMISVGDMVEEVLEAPGGSPAHGGDCGGGELHCEEVAHELGQALLGDELSVQQVAHPRGDAWSVLDRGAHAVREEGFGHGPAGTAEAAMCAMFGDLEGSWLGQIEDLPADGGTVTVGVRQRSTAARKGFLFPTAALSKVFRGKYLHFLDAAHRDGELRLKAADDGGDDGHEFDWLKTALRAHDWVVYTKAPFAGAEHVLAYLGRYTHKTAIANHRLVDFDGEHVRFRWRDYADGNKVKVMRLDADEFIRRFLLHVLPRGFTRLRHYGLLANRCRSRKLALCRDLLRQPAPEPREPETTADMMLRLTGIDITVCRQCGEGTLRQTLILEPQPQAAIQAMKTRPP